MKYKKNPNVKDEQFPRLTGIKRSTFEKVIEILRKACVLKHAQGGRPMTLQPEKTY